MKHRNNILTPFKVLKYLILIVIMVCIIIGTIFALGASRIMMEVPDLDSNLLNMDLSETSSVYDKDGNLIQKIETAEYRTIVGIEKMPANLQNAFIAIEDERFKTHIGIDPKGILSSLRDNFLSGDTARGASTITQQLVKNIYLTPAKTLTRKLTEITMAIQLEKKYSKMQILESYLNMVSMGQNAYGVQEAAQTYFSKNVEDINLVEAAMLASVVKNPNVYPPFFRVNPKDFDPDTMYKVGQIEILGQTYILVYNKNNEERARLVLNQMHKLGYIDDAAYEWTKTVDMKTLLVPGEKKKTDITNYFLDYVNSQVTQDLMDKFSWSKERAQQELFYGGLKIYSTINIEYQKILEDTYANFTQILVGNPDNVKGPILLDISKDSFGNLVNSRNEFIYLAKDNIISQDGDIYFTPEEFSFSDSGNLIINSNKLNIFPKRIDVMDYYTIDNNKNLVSHAVGDLPFSENEFLIENNKLVVYKNTLDKYKDLFRVNEGYLYLDHNQVYINTHGVPQPQSASILIDYRNGHILALLGGRDVDGNRFLNRATNATRQPGSTIKPLSVYLPALENGFTAGSAIDDVPLVVGGRPWPQNWYLSYRGLHTLRYAVEQSVNVSAVRVLNSIGTDKSIEYLKKMGIINVNHPDRDSFITKEENPNHNDENPSALALGGMTQGTTPLSIAAAFGAIANEGVFVEPICYTKVLDKDGNVLLEKNSNTTQVASPQNSYIMKDILRTVVTNGIGSPAQLKNQVVAGKTGTTQNTADLWFAGFTDYYVGATWIGSDSPQITMNKNSLAAAKFWKAFMEPIHAHLESRTKFNKPDGIITVSICTQSGKLPTELCGRDPRGTVRSEIFVKGTEPKEVCDIHVEAEICTESGKLATEFCPAHTKEMRVFIKRNPPYNPAEHGGIIPSDYQYQVPTEYCDIHDENTPHDINLFDENDPNNNSNENNNENNSDNNNEENSDTNVDLFNP